MKNKTLLLAVAATVLWPAVSKAQTVEYYHLDVIGSVRAVTNQTGQVIERHDYLPFGEECTTGICVVNPGITGGQPTHFVGKERDAESGFDYFEARYYNASLARFTTADPIGVLPDRLRDPQQFNPYIYARNNPLRFLDPTGMIIDDTLCRQNSKCNNWEDQYLQSPEGQKQFNKLNEDKVRITLRWDPEGKSATTDKYMWDRNSGDLVSVTVTLTSNGGDPSMISRDATSRPFLIKLLKKIDEGESSENEAHVYMFAHELAHVEDAMTPEGHASIQKAHEMLDATMNSQEHAEWTRLHTRNENVADQGAKGIVESYEHRKH